MVHFRRHLAVFYKAKYSLPYYPEIMLLCIFPANLNAYTHIDTEVYMEIFAAALFITTSKLKATNV